MPDHPRTRGVYPDAVAVGYADEGSSPHTRGLPRPALAAAGRPGIIPAHAGFTTCRARARGSVWDHPRTRGVYDGTRVLLLVLRGSSPHTQGLRVGCHPGHGLLGIIPAHAGFTCLVTPV